MLMIARCEMILDFVEMGGHPKRPSKCILPWFFLHFLCVAFHRGTLTFEVRLITRHYHSTKLPLETLYFYFWYCQHSQKVVAFMVML